MKYKLRQGRARYHMRLLRKRSGKTQAECAAALGIVQPSYAQLESGRTEIIRRRDLVTLAHLYGLTLDDAFPDCLVLPLSDKPEKDLGNPKSQAA